MKTLNLLCRTALPLLMLCAPLAAGAQESAATPPPPPSPEDREEIEFSSDTLVYDEQSDTVTASGQVRMRREGNDLQADAVTWNRRTGAVVAEGNVRVISPEGHVAYGDRVDLTDTLRDGVVANLLLVLEDGGRLAAESGERRGGYTILNRAAYSPCAVTSPEGCPQDPTWQINAVRVVHDPNRRRIYYQGAHLNLFGRPIVPLPRLSHPDGSRGGGTGLLVPDLRLTGQNGVELAVPYYWRIAPNRDLTVTPHVYTVVLPMIEAAYRQLTSLGAFRVRGLITYGERVLVDPPVRPVPRIEDGFRAYIEANGRYQLTPEWSVSGVLRWASDRTFLRRYDISNDDRLRSTIEVERLGQNSYISIAGWAFQGLRLTDAQGQQPIAFPAIDARWRLPDPFMGGRIEVQANSLAILRTEGQDSRRAFASARWDRRSITAMGQELTLTAYLRGDVYHADETGLTSVAIYRGREGWSGRVIGALAADLRWPFIGQFLGGTQRVTPRLQLVASPPTENLDIPNEDARSVDLEDSNLFALNRFPGYDRWEDGVRVTYGADWDLDFPSLAIRANIGQSYRLNRRQTILPQGTGLADRFSDIVGRTTVRFGRFVSLTHRFRLDKDDLAIRRNELDATAGSRWTYFTIGYLRLDRDVDTALEDLRDREELRLAGRVRFARYWSVFGSTVIDLTGREEDPTSLSDGFAPVRHRIGILYDDDCIELGITWRRDYFNDDFNQRRGNSFLFRVALRNLGR